MAILSTDILYKYSTATGPGNSTAGTGPTSLGGFISTTVIPDGTPEALFDDVSDIENAAEQVEYRVLFVHNAHASITLTDARVYITSAVAGGADFAISVDSTPGSAIGSGSAQSKTVADDVTAPAGQTFYVPIDTLSSLPLGDIPAGECRAVWVERTATNSGPVDSDGIQIRVAGGTSE